jgi:hypothetical protein
MTSNLENTPGKKKLGRPPRAEKFGGHIAAAEQKIADNLPEIVDNLLRLAHGVKMADEDDEGNFYIYIKAPDRQANEYLMNRIMGKPTDQGPPPSDEDEDPPATDEDGQTLEP